MGSQDPHREGPVDTEPVNQGRPRSKVVGGRFVIERLIARGGMGAVYLAHQLNLGRPVALKIMTPPPDPEEGESFEDRFRLEAETLASLHHSNIVTVYDYGPTDDGRYYLALEYVEGPRFTDLIRKGRMDADRVVRLMLQVCDALHYAHRRGVVHRDLKPSNLLIRVEDGVENVKVVDFGLVKVMEADQSLTRAGLVLGSPHCMAPEQVRGEDIDHRADIYAIGILLFRALTGTWPFHGETVAATMIAHVHEPVPTFYSVAPDLEVPPGLEEIVHRCLAKAPAERFADAGALIEALAACMDVPRDQFHTVSSFHARVRPTAGRGTGRGLLIGIGVALAALVVVIGLLITRPWQGASTGSTADDAPIFDQEPAAATPVGAASPPVDAVPADAVPADAAPADAAVPADAAGDDEPAVGEGSAGGGRAGEAAVGEGSAADSPASAAEATEATRSSTPSGTRAQASGTRSSTSPSQPATPSSPAASSGSAGGSAGATSTPTDAAPTDAAPTDAAPTDQAPATDGGAAATDSPADDQPPADDADKPESDGVYMPLPDDL